MTRERRPRATSPFVAVAVAIVKGFVLAHGGRVWVESEEGQGSTFGLALPLEAPTQ